MTTKLPSKVTPAPPIPALQVPYMVAYHGVDGAQHQQRFNGLVGQGYRILSCSIYGDPASPRYASVWVNRPGPGWRRSPSTAARPHVNETATTYQADFDAETQLPFRPSWVSRAADGSYASVFRDDSVGDWVARHELPAAQYQAEFDTQVAAGRIPISVQGGGTGSATRYARAYTWAEPGYAATSPDDAMRLASCYGGEGWQTEVMDSGGGLATNASALVRYVAHHPVWGNGDFRVASYERDGSMAGVSSMTICRGDGIDWAVIFNTRAFPATSTVSLTQLHQAIDAVFAATPIP